MPRIVRETLVSIRDLAVAWGPFFVLGVALLIAAYFLLDPTPPRKVVLATGPDQSAYAEFGKRYAEELKRHGIQVELRQTLLHYLPSPMLHFHDDSGFRTCIPDGLHVTHQNDTTRFTIFEIKSQHMPEAWWQLRRLYEPVVRALQPKAEVALVEICRTLDAHTPFPEEPELIEDLKTFISTASDGRFGVFRWRI